MANETEKSVTDLITALVTKNTFSLDAVAGIDALKKQALRLEENAKTYQRMYHDSEEKASKYFADLNKYREREAALIVRENLINRLETSVAVETARSEVYRDVVTKMFANRMLRESAIIGHVTPNPQGGYTTTTSTSDSKTIEEG